MDKFSARLNELSLYFLSYWHRHAFVRFALMASLLFLSLHAFADSGSDILANTDGALTATLKGKGKEYLYITEGIASLAAYIKTKNLLFLAGIVVVALFFNGMLSIAGVS